MSAPQRNAYPTVAELVADAPIFGQFEESAPTLPISGVTGVTRVQPSSDAASGCNATDDTGVTGVTSQSEARSVPAGERPLYLVLDERERIKEHGPLRPGVYQFGAKSNGEGNAPTLTHTWICSPLHLDAVTHDTQENHFGRLLRFRNTNGTWRTWAMPMELLAGHGDELRRELLAMGVAIDPAEHRLLGRYLQSLTPKRRVRCALQTGWCGEVFVLPDRVIGTDAENVTFQSGERAQDEFTCGGTLDGWRSEVAARAIGNPLLTLAISASFAGPLLAQCHAESGGLHFVGDSSTGKTTALEVACATWGGPNYKRSWRATANGMEGAAAMFNDSLLALDEISECDPREVGAIVYALGNGRGKQRAGRSGNARGVTRWRCFVLSSGERGIATAMAEGGHRIKAGQSVRLLDVAADRAFGIWDDLHGFASGAALSDAVKQAAATHYGHAGREFLRRLTVDNGDFGAALNLYKTFLPIDGEGQDKRAAARFALIALAGELATDYGVTGWPEGSATAAALVGFQSWRAARGRGNGERRQIVERLGAFIERHGDARFSNADHEAATPVHNRAGWWRNEGGERVYLFTADAMSEALNGFDLKRALDTLQSLEVLPPSGTDGRRGVSERIGGRVVRLYRVRADRLGEDHGR